MRERYVIGVSLSKDTLTIIRKLKARGINISKLTEIALRYYISRNPALLDLLDENTVKLLI